jgi:hypothetical protein
MDRQGSIVRTLGQAQPFRDSVRVDPTGRWLAVTITSLNAVGAWRYDLERDGLTAVSSFADAGPGLIWQPPTGRRLVTRWCDEAGTCTIAVVDSDEPAPQVLVAEGGFPASFTPDGRRLAVAKAGDILVYRIEDRTATLETRIGTPAVEDQPEFSPDGRWIAYSRGVGPGRSEIFVRPYPGPGSEEQVSFEGGLSAAWNPTGRELFFVSGAQSVPGGQRHMMAVDFEPGRRRKLGRPRALFHFTTHEFVFPCNPVRCYDVAPGGRGFYVVRVPPRSPLPTVTHINLIPNWVDELKAKVPGR